MYYDQYKVAPGHTMIKLDAPVTHIGALQLPDEEQSRIGTVVKVGPSPVWFWRVFWLSQVVQFVSTGDRVWVPHIKYQSEDLLVIVETNKILCIDNESGELAKASSSHRMKTPE